MSIILLNIFTVNYRYFIFSDNQLGLKIPTYTDHIISSAGYENICFGKIHINSDTAQQKKLQHSE